MVRVTDGMSARVSCGTDKQTAAAAAKRVIHDHRRLLHDVVFIHVGDDADNAAGAKTSKIGPQIGRREAPVERVTVGEQPLRHALVDDGHKFLAGTVAVCEIPAGDDRNAEHCEILRGNDSQPTRRGFFAVGGLVALDDKLQLGVPAVAPGHAAKRHALSRRDTFHAWQLADPSSDFLDDGGPRLVRYTWRQYSRKVDRQDLSQVIAGVRGLQGRQRGDQHAGARKQHKGARDLRRGKDPQTTVRAGRDPHAAAGQPQTAGAIG